MQKTTGKVYDTTNAKCKSCGRVFSVTPAQAASDSVKCPACKASAGPYKQTTAKLPERD